MELLFDLLVQFKWAVAASIIMGAVLPVFGVYFIMKRMVLMGIALPQVASAGIALVVLIAQKIKLFLLKPGQSPFLEESCIVLIAPIGSFLAILVVLLIITWCEHRGMFREAMWGTVYIVSAALMVILLVLNPYAESHIATMMEGMVITVTTNQLLALFLVSFAVIVLFLFLNKGILLTSFDSDMAKSMGLKVTRWNIMHYLLFGIIISMGVMMLGPMFVFGYLLLPAFAARPWSVGMKKFYLVSSLLGGISAFTGVILSLWLNWPLGPTEVLAASLVLLFSKITHLIYTALNKELPVQNAFSN